MFGIKRLTVEIIELHSHIRESNRINKETLEELRLLNSNITRLNEYRDRQNNPKRFRPAVMSW